MQTDLGLLALTAVTLGIVHTAAGPDHYIPFVALARAGRWSLRRTLWVTVLCGLGHLGSSVVIGALGIFAGLGVATLEPTESFRGNIAAWMLMGFGLIYAVWGIRHALRSKHVHSHSHHHDGGLDHTHTHGHIHSHDHPHIISDGLVDVQAAKDEKRRKTAWAMFLVFVLGPCEPLIPLLMYPAAKQSMAGVVLVTTLFSLATIGTMIAFVMLGVLGLNRINLGRFERYSHAVAGLVILLSGGAIQFLGL